MCGIFGYAGVNPNKINIDKINTLGILNEVRGVDSCGIAMDGQILKGVGQLAKFRNFAARYRIDNPML